MTDLGPEVEERPGHPAPLIQEGERGSSTSMRSIRRVAPSPPDNSEEAEKVEVLAEIEIRAGLSRFRDPYTAALGILASEWESQHRSYQAATLRALHVEDAALRSVIEESAAGTLALRESIGKRMKAVLRNHPLYKWMTAHRGFPKGAHTARLLSAIGDPLRFPGRVCAKGHHLPSDFDGSRCPLPVYAESGNGDGSDGGGGDPRSCGAVVGPVRRGTGTRSLWHYCGLHVVDGRLARQKRGQQGTWRPEVRGLLLMPDVGLAAQLIRAATGKGRPAGVQPWRGIYDASKERITRERGVVQSPESERLGGSSPALTDSGEAEAGVRHEIECHHGLDSPNGNGGGVDRRHAIAWGCSYAATTSAEGVKPALESGVEAGPLRPFQIEQRARMIAVKAMLGDALAEWKRLVS